ncbi:helix-turn-helix domain-containing protein [Streptomyces montanisoli]|uniref:ImmA/IrrE family metallo-endopeptidase n=1 Tax=Streptomyces montanisoli TaxID=2798581 RepID=A0A940MED7_9ACTN|nr:XRE family transcriptional regulator [Streptomyces montanisoli]MBP0459497.1 ImmA/IrrE family metallo-endopeptidase [Streptomyces montanisoli]
MDLRETGERVAQERTQAGLSQRELAVRAELSQSTLARIETGERSALTVAELDRIATALGVPLTLLTKGNPVRQRMQVAARASEGAEEDLRRAEGLAGEILALDDRLDRYVPDGHRGDRQRASRLKRPLTRVADPEREGRSLAEELRERLGLGFGPVSDLDELVESAIRLDTAALTLPPGVSGFTALDPDREVTISVVNASHVPERQRFSLAHELGHVLLSDGVSAHRLDGRRTPAEKRCDAFARHLLAPAEGVRRWMECLSAPEPGRRECAMAARHYGVSLTVLLIQCKELGLLTNAQATKMKGLTGRELAWTYGWGPQYIVECEAAARVRPPRRIMERAVEAYRSGHIGVRAIASLSGAEPRTTERELDEAGIRPPQVALSGRVDVRSLVARRGGRVQRAAEPPENGRERR